MAIRPKRILITACLWTLAFSTGCQSTPQTKRYVLTGNVVAVHSDSSSLTIHNDDLPGVMPPMDMDYHVANAKIVEGLKSGDKIKATLVIADHAARLEDVAVLGK